MKVEVFNVGQGDSFLIRDNFSLQLKDIPLIVDLGPQKAKVSDMLNGNRYHILITHSHNDHIGGFPKVYKDKIIESITIPYYFSEIIKIAEFINGKTPKIYGKLDWRKIKKINHVNLVGEGDLLFDNIYVYNPPKSPYDYFRNLIDEDEELNLREAFSILEQYGFDLPYEDIENYTTPLNFINNNDNEFYAESAKTFVHRFFISLSRRLIGNPIESAKYYATSHLELSSNQSSIVFLYKSKSNDNWLFTGDADESVFHRILLDRTKVKDFQYYPFFSHGIISAKYLKVPHHGSRENLNQFILECIDPEVAIVSHKNGKFGKSKDSHPHSETLDMLDLNKIRTYYTNPVIKGGKTIKNETLGIVEGGVLEFK